ncbi:MAG: ribonuclease III [Alistipes sp.]|nr:ribonuclease III [Alistipes sp.]
MFGFIPNNIELYKLALIHKSASVTLDNGQHINNERLEFLGDAVIESVSSDYLFIEFPDKNEGFLTQMRSKMVSRQSLNAVAKRIGLDDHVITNSTNNSAQKHIYGDAFEAMMGAIYLDQGYDFVNRLLINKIFAQYLKVDTLLESETDFKSRLIEWCQKNHHTIHFSTSHDKTYSTSHPFFYSTVMIDNIEVGHGAGESKKEAEQRAAHSVSQGFNDDDCTKLLDKLDNIDTAYKPAPKRAEKSASKNEAAPKKEAAPKAEIKEEPKGKKSTKKSEATEEKVVEPAINAEPAAEPTTEAKPKRRSRRSAKPKQEELPVVENNATGAKTEAVATEVVATETVATETVATETVTTDAPSTEESATATKPKRSRRRRPAKDGTKAEAQEGVKTEAQEGAKSDTPESAANESKADSAASEKSQNPAPTTENE